MKCNLSLETMMCCFLNITILTVGKLLWCKNGTNRSVSCCYWKIMSSGDNSNSSVHQVALHHAVMVYLFFSIMFRFTLLCVLSPDYTLLCYSRRHTLSRRRIIPLPQWKANPETDPEALFSKDQLVLALYPQTTCFYRALIHNPPHRVSTGRTAREKCWCTAYK